MFEAKLNDATLLRKIIDAIKDLVTEVNFECSSAGIALQAMDNSHVSLVALELPAGLFDEYRCDRNIVLGMNIGNVAKILKCAQSDFSLHLKALDDGSTLNFTFESSEGDRVYNFSLKLMSLDGQTLVIPDEKPHSTVTMNSDAFAKVIRDLSTIGEAVVISTSHGCVNFHATGGIGDADLNMLENDTDENKSISVDFESSVKQKFSIKFMQHFTKAYNLSSKVKLHLQKDRPVTVDYELDEKVGGYLRFYLAPSCEDEEEEGLK